MRPRKPARKKRATKAPRRKRGRPRAGIDLGIVERLAIRQSSLREIAAIIGVDEKTLRDRIQSDPNFSALIAKGRESGRNQLRAKQFAVAMKGNVSMLIWLGKQYLGQMDEARLRKLGGPVNAEELRQTLDLKGLSDAELAQLDTMLEKTIGTKESKEAP